MIRNCPALGIPKEAGYMEQPERARIRAAARHARRVYPGPVGELVHRELNAYADFGLRFDVSALIPSLVEHVLKLPVAVRGEAAS